MSAAKSFRIDHGQLRKPVRTPQGFLRVEGYVARAGIYEYRNTEEDSKNGHGPVGAVRRELRPAEELFNDRVMNGYEGAPLTALHPKVKNDLVKITPANVRSYEIGTAIERAHRADGDRLAVAMIVKDQKAITRVEKGELNELSPGYESLIVKRSGADKRYGYAGNPEGRYDCVQTEIDINHLALVPRARGGSDLRMRMDGADDCAIEHREDASAKLTSVVDGHQHLIDLDPSWCGKTGSGSTSWAVAEGADIGHEHAWLRNTDGSITIAESAGHTHTILDDNRYAAVRTDAVDPQPRQGDRMPPIEPDDQIRSLKVQLTETEKTVQMRQDALDAAVRDRDGANARAKTLEERISELESQISAGANALETEAIAKHAMRADEAEKTLRELQEKREADIRKAAEVRVKAITVMGPEFRIDGLADRAIQATVIKRFAPKENLGDDVSDAYIATRFDSLVEAHHKNARSHTRIGEVLAAGATGASGTGKEPRADSREGRANAWRNQAYNGTQPHERQKDE